MAIHTLCVEHANVLPVKNGRSFSTQEVNSLGLPEVLLSTKTQQVYKSVRSVQVHYILGQVTNTKTHCPVSIVAGDQVQRLRWNYDRQMAPDIPVSVWLLEVLRQHRRIELALEQHKETR